MPTPMSMAVRMPYGGLPDVGGPRSGKLDCAGSEIALHPPAVGGVSWGAAGGQDEVADSAELMRDIGRPVGSVNRASKMRACTYHRPSLPLT